MSNPRPGRGLFKGFMNDGSNGSVALNNANHCCDVLAKVFSVLLSGVKGIDPDSDIISVYHFIFNCDAVNLEKRCYHVKLEVSKIDVYSALFRDYRGGDYNTGQFFDRVVL